MPVFRVVDLTDKANQEKGIQWWEELTAAGGEGMVVKPLEFVTKGRKGLAQPVLENDRTKLTMLFLALSDMIAGIQGTIRTTGREAAVKGSFAVVFTITALSLGAWFFFYIESVPLTPAETTVIVGLCAVLVLFAKWTWDRLAKRREKDG